MLVALFVGLGLKTAGVSYDARAQMLEADGVAAADLRAPNAEVARVRAERHARAQAEERLKSALLELGFKSPLDMGLLNKFAKVIDEQFGSDGTVSLRLRLSLKELREPTSSGRR